MIIWGNTISTNTSRPDYAETNEELASFIKNKPDAAIQKAQDTADNANTAAGNAQKAADDAQKTADSKVAQITAEIVLTASGWSGERQTVTVEGVTTINTVFIAPVPASIEPFGYYEITCVKQGNGNLTFGCEGEPDTDITLNVVILDVTVSPESGNPAVPGEDGGYYIPVVKQTGTNTVKFEFNPSETDMPKVDPVSVTLPAGTGSGGTADPAGTAANAVSGHNSAADAHADIRLQLTAINDRLKAFFDSDDQTLDELSEIVAYITSNKSLIDAITTSKVSVLDIVNDLVTNVPAKPLSAAQGVVLKGLIDNLSTGKLDASKLQEAINTALAQAKASGEFDGKAGYTPVRGTDYWTEADQEAIVQQVITALGTPVFGRVDTDNNIILTGTLADGIYTLWYEDENGKTTELCEYTKGGVSYKNWIRYAIDTDESIYNGVGYKTASRINSSGGVSDVANTSASNPAFATGFIPVKTGDVFLLENCYIDTDGMTDEVNYWGGDKVALRICLYNKANYGYADIAAWNAFLNWDLVTATADADGHITEFTITKEGINGWLRFTLGGDPETAIMTINEEITD